MAQRAFILGAGFSAAQGYPLIRQFRQKVRDHVRQDNHPLFGCPAFRDLLKSVESSIDPDGTLTFDQFFTKVVQRCGMNDRATVSLRETIVRMLWRIRSVAGPPLRCYIDFAKLLQEECEPTIISLNWDVLFEEACRKAALPFYYGLTGNGLKVVKPHGSINWERHNGAEEELVRLGWKPVYQSEGIYFCPNDPFVDPDSPSHHSDRRVIVYPTPPEGEADSFLPEAVEEMREALRRSTDLVFIGYSLPPYDTDFRRLFFDAAEGDLRKVTVVAPDDQTLKRFRQTFGPTVRLIPHPFQDSLGLIFGDFLAGRRLGGLGNCRFRFGGGA